MCLFLETTPIATLDFTADIEHPSVSALPEVSSASPRTEVATADREENAAMILLSQAEEEMVVVSDKTEEQEKMQDEEEKETKTLAAVRGTLTRTSLRSLSKLRTLQCVK